MKKVLSMIAALLLCVGTQAQIVSSRSAIVKTEKQASSTQWFLRAGLNIMNFSGDGAEGADSNIGYNATFGYQKPLGSTGGYWGMEFGLGSRGFKVDDTKCMAHNIQYSPFTFGWKFAVADNVRIDPHVGVWYDRFNLDLIYQRGFIDTFSDADGFKTSNFMIRLGIAF